MTPRFLSLLAMYFAAFAAVAAARSLGSERTLTGAGGVATFPGTLPTLPPSASGKTCSPFNTAGTSGCPAMGTVGNPDHGQHWFSGATIKATPSATSACPDFSSTGGFKYELVDGVCVLRISFDDIALRRSVAVVLPSGYKGFQWSNIAVFNPSGYQASGYDNSIVSPSNVGVAMPAPASEMVSVGADGVPFTFNLVSLHATAAWNNGLTVVFTGYTAGVEKATQTVILDTKTPTLVKFGAGWEGLDKLSIASSGGVQVPTYTGAGNNVALEDILVA